MTIQDLVMKLNKMEETISQQLDILDQKQKISAQQLEILDQKQTNLEQEHKNLEMEQFPHWKAPTVLVLINNK